jgi:hypothetical protein
MTVGCDDMNSIIQDDLDKGEAIYPGKPGYMMPVDDVFPGLGRVWVYWAIAPDRRVVKTIITYTFNGETKTAEKAVPANAEYVAGYMRDSLEITGLEEGYYSFSMNTVDKDGHRSVTTPLYPQIVRVYGDVYLGTLLPRGIESTEMLAGGNLKVTWVKDTTNVNYSLITHTDYSTSSSGIKRVDTVFNTTATSILTGFTRLQTFSVTSNRQVGIDTAPITEIHAAPVVEKTLLTTAPNGLAELTAAAANGITELAYPIGIESWRLQDLYYFPNLRTLDLTPGTRERLPELSYYTYYRDKTGVDATGYDVYDTAHYENTIGGCPWSYIVSGYMLKSDINIIDSLLASGQLTKVKYTRNSYPGLDAVLAKYSGKIEWNPVEPLPAEGILIPHELLVDYGVVDRNKGVNLYENTARCKRRGNVYLTYSEDGSNVPADIRDKFTGDLKNVYRVEIGERLVYTDADPNKTSEATATIIAFALPTGELQLGLGRLKFDCYIASSNGYEWLTAGGVSAFNGWKKVKVWCSRFLPGAGDSDNTPYRAESFPTTVVNDDGSIASSPYRANDHEFTRATNDAGTDIAFGEWTPLQNSGGVAGWDLNAQAPGHFRVIRIQFGADGAPRLGGRNLVYYLANLRFEK